MTRLRILLLGIAATLAFSALWHGPLGAGARFASGADTVTQRTLTYYEMTKVQGRMQSSPMTRRILLSGPANDFQRAELVRMLNDVPGILDAAWTNGNDRYTRQIFLLPLAVEAQLLGLASFAVGMIIAYLFELRRRANVFKRKI